MYRSDDDYWSDGDLSDVSDDSDIKPTDSPDQDLALVESDEQEYRAPSSSHLKHEYATFADFERDLKEYSTSTYQTFIKRRTEKLPKDHALANSLVYRKVHYECVHHSTYKSEGTGKRLVTRSRRKECGAGFDVYAQIRKKILEVKNVSDSHNHPLSEATWKHLPKSFKAPKSCLA